jgi:hypothetical protein
VATVFFEVKNRASGTLASGMDATQTTVPLVSGGASAFPSAFPFRITIDNEIIRVNGAVGDTFDPVVRAQEGTTGAPHTSGAVVESRITAQQIADIHSAINALENVSHVTRQHASAVRVM